MTYDGQRGSFSREHIYIVEIDLDYCPLTHGTAPCTATETGDDKCFNTFGTCNDLPNYRAKASTQGIAVRFATPSLQTLTLDSGQPYTWLDLGFRDSTPSGGLFNKVRGSGWASDLLNTVFSVNDATNSKNLVCFPGGSISDESFSTDHLIEELQGKTYRFCQPRSPHPIGIDAIPSLQSVSLTPSKIDLAGGMGERSSVSLTFNDHPHNDADIDKYTGDRTYLATDRGTFWTKFRARNQNYQFRELRVLTGYLEDGEYKAENFKTRYYVIEKLDVSGGKCRITAKDTLKKAGAKKAQVPAPNSGTIANVGGISAAATSITLQPAGVGDSEYAASGYVTLSGSEVASFTRSGDTLTIVRGQYNTTAKAHDEDAVVQQCYQQTAEVNTIVSDILRNFANIEARFINETAWQTEVDTTPLNGNLDGIIAKPTDVEKVLKELAEAKPHFVYWDEFEQTIRLKALQPPPAAANAFTSDSNLLADSVRVMDRPELRASTVYVTFGQIDPTKSLTSPENFTQTVVRVDTDSIAKYDSNQIKTITSRWIPSTNKAIAQDAAQLLGRRFSDIPREISFSVDAKDNEPNIGDTRAVNHHDMVDATGSPVDVIFQLVSKQEAGRFNYKAVEYTFGDTIASDNDLSSDTILISIDEQNLDLRARYEANIGTPTGSTSAVFKIESGVVVGSSSISTPGIDTGLWPAGATVTLINEGFIVGKGGDGAGVAGSPVATSGGDAINLQHDMTLTNLGVVGGGGGGYSGDYINIGSISRPYIVWTSGGGAGNDTGTNGGYGFAPSLESGGQSLGGALGETPSNSAYGTSGSAGKAVDLNGNTLTYDSGSDIRGVVS